MINFSRSAGALGGHGCSVMQWIGLYDNGRCNLSMTRTLNSFAILSKIWGHYNTARIHRCFKKCRDELDHLFDTLPPPRSSVSLKDESENVKTEAVSMSQYHNKNGPCLQHSVGRDL
jgi:hypothetical protein